uniref:HTH CENPB-type domain-containing protein n=1 Tax=Clytia hemisphaerica TaxID=252671 RepID=A0A7M5V219_9CNID
MVDKYNHNLEFVEYNDERHHQHNKDPVLELLPEELKIKSTRKDHGLYLNTSEKEELYPSERENHVEFHPRRYTEEDIRYSEHDLANENHPDRKENYEEHISISAFVGLQKETLTKDEHEKIFEDDQRNKINGYSFKEEHSANCLSGSEHNSKLNLSSNNNDSADKSHDQPIEDNLDSAVHTPLEFPTIANGPRPKKAAPKKRYTRTRYSNEELQVALSKCREGLSIRECSKKYGIPKSTLWDKLSCRTPATVLRPGRSFKVSDAVENRLVNWILKMNEDGFKVQEKQIIEAVKLFHDKSEGVNANDNSHSKPGKAWYKNFLKRYPAAQHNLSVNHKKAEYSIEMLQAWYDETVDTEVPVLVESVESVQPKQPEPTTPNQIRSVLDHIEQTIGEEKLNYYRQWKENGELSKKDPLYTAWYALAVDLDRIHNSNKNKRKRKSEQPRVNGNYVHQHHHLENSKVEHHPLENDLIDLNSTTTTAPNLEFTENKDTRTVENNLPQSHYNGAYVSNESESVPPDDRLGLVGSKETNSMSTEDHTNFTKPHPRRTMMLSYSSK